MDASDTQVVYTATRRKKMRLDGCRGDEEDCDESRDESCGVGAYEVLEYVGMSRHHHCIAGSV